ncbi:MAG: hypothetical protein P8R04_06215 [Gammaproteobacteria bacterium]|nr:hypothetical protein [Gammaproteobacteria bacterium]
MKKTNYFFQVLLLSLAMPICVPGTVIAAETDSYISEQDCAAIRDANGIAPKSIPADVAEQCKQIPLVVPAAGAAADPCAEGGGSIYCWGPWDTLAPAAYGGGQAPIEPLSGQDPRPELSTVFDKDLDPPLELPLDSCPAGSTSCGFATVIEGSAGSGNPDNTAVVNFAMTSDGSSFTVDPGNAGEIQSVNGMTTALAPRGGDDYILDSVGVESGQTSTQVSQLQARVVSPDGTTLTSGSDFWANANIGTPTVVNSGYFVWGTSTSIADLESLNNVSASVNFSGTMSGDSGTTANVTLNYGPTSTWTGNWNGNYNFDAGGQMVGVDFISSADQFSSNVAGGYVQGVALGPAGNQSVGVAVNVTLDTVGGVRDVGLLQQTP